MVKVDDQDALQWQKALGGSEEDLLSSIIGTNDGGFIASGFTGSNDGDVSGNHGSVDGWVVKLDSGGDIQWQRCVGGSGIDQLYSVVATADGGYVAVGSTNSSDGDVSGSLGGPDGWVVKLDSLGNVLWDHSLGGSGTDILRNIRKTSDGGFVVAGETGSTDGYATGNHGGNDMWIEKLGPEAVGIREQRAAIPLAVFPNPARDAIWVEYEMRSSGQIQLEVQNGTGQLVWQAPQGLAPAGKHRLAFDASQLAPGAYHLRLITRDGVAASTFVKVE